MWSPKREPAPISGAGFSDSILVVDDTPENVRLLKLFLSQRGYEVLSARSGAEAVDICQKRLPDLIIMDVCMPGMDGFEAARAIRQLSPQTWVPIIFLSADTTEISQAKGLESGGDDYLTRPVNLAILHEKIKALRRIAQSQAQVAHYAQALETLLSDIRIEQAFAKHLMRHILPTQLDEADGVRFWIEPARQFSGDSILTARGPGNELYVALLDATGHGLAAAISSMLIIEAFYRLVERGFSVGGIVRELNRKIRGLLPADRFVAAAVAMIDLSSRSLQIWNGGLPEACFIDQDGNIPRRWKALHPPLGVLPDEALQPQPEFFAWNGDGQLFLHSEGLEAALDDQNTPFGLERLRRIMTEHAPPDRFHSVVSEIRKHLEHALAPDDISLVVIDCPAASPAATTRQDQNLVLENGEQSLSNWRVTLRLEANQLRTLDVVPLLMGWLDQFRLAEPHRGTAFVVLAELVNNALDHGLLRLDSSMKSEPDGFERYLNLRARRLASLRDGFIEICMEQLAQQDNFFLRIAVRDSGEGFPYQQFLSRLSDAHAIPSGRGIALVKTLCSQLRYLDKGNEVRALLFLPRLAD